MPSQEVGLPIPNIPHAVSVTLPTWEANIAYEEGEHWVTSKMSSGYPRFYIHSSIRQLCRKLEAKYGREGEECLVFPSYKVAKRCREFLKSHFEGKIRILQLSTPEPVSDSDKSIQVGATFGVVFFPKSLFPLAKSYWQHSGEVVSSRMGEYILKSLFTGPKSKTKQELQAQKIQSRSPSIRASRSSASGCFNDDLETEFDTFIEQKFGRVLDLKFANEAKRALRRRICGKVDKSCNQIEEIEKSKRGKYLSESDVYLFPSGMASIFYAHHALFNILPAGKSVCFGFPYVDTLNILKKFGPGVIFLGLGDDSSLLQLEKDLEEGLKIMALFCECPSNPLLKTPNLKKIKELGEKYDFAIVVDETVGNFINIHVLPYADMVASSLTKVFSGDSNVLAGSLVLNPLSRYYAKLKKFFNTNYEDLFWDEDALWLERNSRDFVERVHKVDNTSEKVVNLLLSNPKISKVYYPSVSPSRHHYDMIKTQDGGYGGLISFVFHKPSDAIKFFNSVDLYKGPSLGTNFSLACPYSILAHYQELDEIEQWGVDRNLIRISIGLEEPEDLLQVLEKSLEQ
ncbi:STR2 [Candida oxycetoniae]|uniref:cystathionine gamma-synthase n=1 Tax=Candida oxycetoniae TaxID=497107 RepID=A0AAI9SXK7_9ASCO|nr:STR2 [Candida oxycetoniae]KAI3404655.2 STR2 [Candida oxycetoniae]